MEIFPQAPPAPTTHVPIAGGAGDKGWAAQMGHSHPEPGAHLRAPCGCGQTPCPCPPQSPFGAPQPLLTPSRSLQSPDLPVLQKVRLGIPQAEPPQTGTVAQSRTLASPRLPPARAAGSPLSGQAEGLPSRPLKDITCIRVLPTLFVSTCVWVRCGHKFSVALGKYQGAQLPQTGRGYGFVRH